MTATLCLLECSRHGLLEIELLALLGDERNTVCPAFDPDADADDIAEKIEEETAVVVENESSNVEKLADQLTKEVDDAYLITTEEEEKEQDKGKETDRKEREKGKKVNFLPAREWAIIYRNLKRLLRPCGDLGEGRLDFYHRSLSKAVRKKFFSGTDEYNTHMKNFWHGVLATYFEGVTDMDRKAEELPYHLEHLLDNNRLVRCLLEWPVFERLFDEDFSVDLMHSWMKAGGYSVAAQLYQEALKVHKSTVTSEEHTEMIEKVATFFIQMGQTKAAVKLLMIRLEIEENELGARTHELANTYQLIAKCKSEDVKQHNFVTMDQLDEDLEVMEYCNKALQYRSKLTSDEDKFKLAMLKVLMVHHLGILADLEKFKAVEHRNYATKLILEAIEYYSEVDDLGHLAEAYMTQSFIAPRGGDTAKKKELLDKALELCLKAYGTNHMLYTRLSLNIGIYYEDIRDFTTAFNYFLQWYEACHAVLGPNHPKTQRAIETMKEDMYARMWAERKRQTSEEA